MVLEVGQDTCKPALKAPGRAVLSVVWGDYLFAIYFADKGVFAQKDSPQYSLKRYTEISEESQSQQSSLAMSSMRFTREFYTNFIGTEIGEP